MKAQDQYHNGVRALLCTEHGILQPEIQPDSIDRFIADANNMLWLDVDTAVTQDLSLLTREFGFHELAIEDATRPHQRPKVDEYQGFTFIIFYAVAPGQTLAHLEARQVAIFVGPNYLVTVHHGPLPEIDESAERWRKNITKIERHIGVLLYSLLDAIVDNYFPMGDRIGEKIEEIEQRVFEHFDQDALEEIFRLKKGLLAMRRVVAPEREVLNTLMRRDAPLFGIDSIVYFQDVYDHLTRVVDSIDLYRDLLSSALDAYLSMASNRLNEIMRTLTSFSIPLMFGALLAGIWGMNFEFMPELRWKFGYAMALSAIIGSIILISLYFRYKKWL